MEADNNEDSNKSAQRKRQHSQDRQVGCAKKLRGPHLDSLTLEPVEGSQLTAHQIPDLCDVNIAGRVTNSQLVFQLSQTSLLKVRRGEDGSFNTEDVERILRDLVLPSMNQDEVCLAVWAPRDYPTPTAQTSTQSTTKSQIEVVDLTDSPEDEDVKPTQAELDARTSTQQPSETMESHPVSQDQNDVHSGPQHAFGVSSDGLQEEQWLSVYEKRSTDMDSLFPALPNIAPLFKEQGPRYDYLGTDNRDALVCAHCQLTNHALVDCIKPDGSGATPGCPLCNTLTHDWDLCPHPRKEQIQANPQAEAELFVKRRGNKPPLMLASPWVDLLRPEIDVSGWAFPWLHAFAKSRIGRGLMSHRWTKYRYCLDHQNIYNRERCPYTKSKEVVELNRSYLQDEWKLGHYFLSLQDCKRFLHMTVEEEFPI